VSRHVQKESQATVSVGLRDGAEDYISHVLKLARETNRRAEQDAAEQNRLGAAPLSFSEMIHKGKRGVAWTLICLWCSSEHSEHRSACGEDVNQEGRMAWKARLLQDHVKPVCPESYVRSVQRRSRTEVPC